VCVWDENRLFRVGETWFATKEAALRFHAILVRLFRMDGSKASELLEIIYSEDCEDDGEDRDPADWWKE
jgi:hypothetical protein